jgi:DNA-binding transcriptional ArsR family regulator
MQLSKLAININETDIQVLNKIWELSKKRPEQITELSVREIHESILKDQFAKNDFKDLIPYTTVASKMKDFEKAGIVEVNRADKTYLITPKLNRGNLAHNMKILIEEMLEQPNGSHQER